MADRLEISVDSRDVLKALAVVGQVADRLIDEVSHDTAARIAEEARRRVRRRTGQTARGITVSKARLGGYLVYVDNPEQPNLDLWLEFGTRYMTASPFLLPGAALEEGPHLRRVAEALERAAAQSGLGE